MTAAEIIDPIINRLQAEADAERDGEIIIAVKNALARCNFRISGSRWAGGNHDITVAVGGCSCAGGSHKAWSSNGKWSGNNSFFRISVPVDWRETVESAGIAVVHGNLTLRAEFVEQVETIKVYKATWVEQGRGFDLNDVSGHIADCSGVFAKGTSADVAVQRILNEAKRRLEGR